MFLSVTLNPALDKTLWVDENAAGQTLRASRAVTIAGGKGVNTARALLALGAPEGVRALVTSGGGTGQEMLDLARREGIQTASAPVAGATRLALTIQDGSGSIWHYLEPGPTLSERELSRIREAFLWALEGCHTLAVCGSLPSASAASLVPWMLRTAAGRGVRTALDSFGAGTLPALQAGPWLAKPNLAEWEATTGYPLATERERWAALEQMSSWGVRLPVLSLGAQGAMALSGGERLLVRPPVLTPVNEYGGGDSMVAGMCWAAALGYNVRDCLAWGAACGAANALVWDPGGIRRDDVELLLPDVRVETV